MARYGIEVSQNTHTKDTKPRDLLYSSEYQSPKLFRVLKGTFTTDVNGYINMSLSHGLIYAPVVLAYIKTSPDNKWFMPDNDLVAMEANRLTVVLRSKNSTEGSAPKDKLYGNRVYNYKFYIFTDPNQEVI